MNHRRSFIAVIIIAVISLLLQGGYLPTQQSAASVFLEGTFIALWGDGVEGSGNSYAVYYLATPGDEPIRLIASEDMLMPLGGAVQLNRHRVVVSGSWLDDGPSLLVQSIYRVSGAQASPQGIYGPQPWVSLLCKFADYTDEPQDKAYFVGMYSDQYPGLDHFWRQNSYDLANLEGSGVSGWNVMPHNRGYYFNPDGSLKFSELASECTGVANPYVDFTPYVGINMMFNADLDCCAWGGGWWGCLDGICQVWRMTWEPPWGYGNIGVIAHETGHGFGLPHSEGPCHQTYDNRWDVLSDVWSNGADPVYGTMGQHTISYHKEMLGWVTSEQVFTATVGTLETITLEKLALPQTNNYLGVVIPIDGSKDHFYTLEVRQPFADPIDYDKWLPGFAVIIHEVTTGAEEPAVVVDLDGDCNTGDAGAMYIAGEVFTDAAHGISVSIDASTHTGYIVTIINRFTNMQGVTISGPAQGPLGFSNTFTATVNPPNSGTPITYTWEATGLEPVIHVGDTVDPIQLTWDEPGTKAITVTAVNAGGSVVDTHLIDIEAGVPLAGVELVGPGIGFVLNDYTFTAQVEPVSTTMPVTYTWVVDAGSPIIHTARISDSLTVAWETAGPHTINVKASNPTSSVTDMLGITIHTKIYLPVSLKD